MTAEPSHGIPANCSASPRSKVGVIAGGETLFDYRDYRNRFDTLAANLSVNPHVLGPVDHDALPSLVSAASAFGFVSTKEGFGLAALEALAAEVPVVARPLPVLEEILGRHVRYGHDPSSIAAALVEAITDGPLPDAPEVAQRYTWPKAAQAHLDLYGLLKTKSAEA